MITKKLEIYYTTKHVRATVMNTQHVFNGSSLLIMTELSFYIYISNLARKKKFDLAKYLGQYTARKVCGYMLLIA